MGTRDAIKEHQAIEVIHLMEEGPGFEGVHLQPATMAIGIGAQTVTWEGRATLPVRSGTLMHPSRAVCGSEAASITGSNSTTVP